MLASPLTNYVAVDISSRRPRLGRKLYGIPSKRLCRSLSSSCVVVGASIAVPHWWLLNSPHLTKATPRPNDAQLHFHAGRRQRAIGGKPRRHGSQLEGGSNPPSVHHPFSYWASTICHLGVLTPPMPSGTAHPTTSLPLSCEEDKGGQDTVCCALARINLSPGWSGGKPPVFSLKSLYHKPT
jgi:hypothetical protein